MITVGTNSYVTEAELESYVAARGSTLSESSEILLIKAMDWLEVQPFIGDKYDSTQALEFPRGTDPDVPDNIKKAQMVAANLINGGAEFWADIGRAVKREKIDVLETEYMDTATDVTIYPELTALLRGYVASSMAVSRG